MAVTKRQSAACTSKLFELKAYDGFPGTVLAPIKRSFSVTFIGHRGASRPTSRLVTLSTRTGSGDAVAGWCDIALSWHLGIVMNRLFTFVLLGLCPAFVAGLSGVALSLALTSANVVCGKFAYCKSICGRSGQTAWPRLPERCTLPAIQPADCSRLTVMPCREPPLSCACHHDRPLFCESYYVSNTIGCTSLYRDFPREV